MDWLKRVYRFSNAELDLAFEDNGFLPLDEDPKTSIAVENLDAFPMDVNHAERDQLLRVPGVGPKSAERIVRNRSGHSIDTWRDLTAMGVVRKRAWPFLAFPGHRPPRSKQLRLDLFGEGAREKRREQATASSTAVRSSLRRADVLRGLSDAGYARPPQRGQRERASYGRVAPALAQTNPYQLAPTGRARRRKTLS